MQLVIPFDVTPRWYRQRGTPKDLRQAQSISSTDASASFQSFPTFFVLGDEATSAHGRVELRVAVKDEGSDEGMVQRILQVDVHASKFAILSFPARHVLDTFQISHLVEAEYPGELVIRLSFRQSVPGWISAATKSKSSKREQIWIRTFHTMTSNQRDYLGALLQGLVGLSKPLNANRHLLCSPTMLKVGREQVSLWIGTWNMGNKPAPDLVPSKHGMVNPCALWTDWMSGNEHDIYAFGLQEMDPSIFQVLDAHFLDKGYVQVSRTHMGVIALTVFCKKRLFAQIRNVQTHVQACGFAGVGTNKGFVCSTITVFDQPLLFINCHLAARDDAKRLQERIHQYKLAVKKLQIGKLPGTDALHQHTTFFFGDMNFRVCTTDKDLWPNSNRTRLEVLDTLYNNKGLDYALQGDQLQIEKSRGLIFDRFREAPITFSPTYKYLTFNRNTVWEEVRNSSGDVVGFVCREKPASEYSKRSALEDGVLELDGSAYYMSCRTTLGSHRREYTMYKTQVPSWCDRILHQAPLPGVRVKQNEYYCVDTIASSDHSPVYASFAVELPQTSSAVPSASFHVCTIQLLNVEVFYFRHPLTAVEGADGGVMQPGFREDLDDDEEEEEDEHHPHQSPVQLARKATIKNAAQFPQLSLDNNDDESSEPEIYSSKRNLNSTTPSAATATIGTATKKNAPPAHFPQLVCAAVFPFLRETSNKSRITSKPAQAGKDTHTWTPNCELNNSDELPEFVFQGKELANMSVGPFLCTREFLQSQYFVLHLIPKSNSETRESAACCVVSLEEGADGRTVNFEEPLSHFGQPSGYVRGKFRVWLNGDGWEEECVADPSLHALAPKDLAKNAVVLASKQRAATTSPPPPFGRKTPVHPLPQLRAKKQVDDDNDDDEDDAFASDEEDEDKLLVRNMELVRAPKPALTDDDDDDDEDEEDDEWDELTRLNTIRNHTMQVTAYQTMYTPRQKQAKTKLVGSKPALVVAPSKRKNRIKSLRRVSMMWGVKMNE